MGKLGLTGLITGIVVFMIALGVLAANITVPAEDGSTATITSQTGGITETSLLSLIFSGFGDLLAGFVQALIPTSCSGGGA